MAPTDQKKQPDAAVSSNGTAEVALTRSSSRSAKEESPHDPQQEAQRLDEARHLVLRASLD